MKFTYLKCSRCGKQVSTALSYEGHDIVVRAWIECPECLEAEANIPSDDDLPQLTKAMRTRMESMPDDLVERLWNEQPSPLQSVITWIPVSERLPEAYKVVLATSPSQGLFMGWHRCSVTDWIIHLAPLAMRPIEDVTHWAELPTPPASEEDAVEAELDAEKAAPFPEDKVQRMLAKLKGDIPLGQPPAGEEGEG